MKVLTLFNKKEILFRKTFFVVLIRVSGVCLTFLFLISITKFFNENLVGEYNYMSTILVFAGSLCLLGMDSSYLLFSGKLEAENSFIEIVNLYHKKIIIILSIHFLIVILYSITIFFFNPYIAHELEDILLKAIIASPFFALCNLNFQVIRVLDKIILSEIFRSVTRNVFLILSVFYIKGNCEPNALLDYVVASFIFVSFVTFFVIKFLMKKLKKNNNIENITEKISFKEILKTSLPMTISFFALLIMQSIDVVILKFYEDYDQIALYGIVVKISSILVIFLSSINTIIAPKISELYYSQNKKELTSLINKSIKLNFALTFPVSLLILLFPSFFLGIFGESYLLAKNALLIIISGQIINCLSGSTGIYLNMTGRQKVFQQVILTTLILNIILNIILIPKYGIEGAAFSTFLSLFVWNVYSVIYIYKKDRILMFLN